MNIRKRSYAITIFLMVILTACGAPKKEKLKLSGTIDEESVAMYMDKPILVMIARSEDINKLEDDPESYILRIISVDKSDLSFSFDLSETDLKEGESVTVIAFVDTDYTKNNTPFPKSGDLLGIYTNSRGLTLGHTLTSGTNHINLAINREVFDFDVSVRGTVNGESTGDLTLIAYNGDFISTDFTTLDFDKIAGYTKIDKSTTAPIDYRLDIFPYGQNLPIENTLILSVLDVDRNGKINGGDKVGYYTNTENDLPRFINITADMEDINIDFHMDITDSSGFDISIAGLITTPKTFDFSTPLYILVANNSDMDELMENPASAIKHFERVPDGKKNYKIDLSKTDLIPGDEIILIALWDKNYKGGFPHPDPGDFMGFYVSPESIKASFPLKEGENKGFHIDINREVFNYEATLTGTVAGIEKGDLTLIAYTGQFDSSDVSDLDFDKIVGFKQIDKSGPNPLSYAMKLLPYGQNLPLKDTFILALLDVNRNGTMDGGDKVGYYSKGNNDLPTPITIDGDLSEIDISFQMDVADPSGFNITLEGTAEMPGGYTEESPPLFIIVAEGDNLEELMANPVSGIKYFRRIPSGKTDFKIDLTGTDLIPGDDILLLALWDINYTAGFPYPDKGDQIGYYVDSTKLSASYTLSNVSNPEIRIAVNKEIFDFEASIEGRIKGDYSGELTLVAYNGEITSSDFTQLDPDAICGYKKMTKENHTQNFKINILPFGSNLPLENVFVFAVLDANNNGKTDGGDRIGYFSGSEKQLPTFFNVEDNVKNIDVDFYMVVAEPSGYTIKLNGSIGTPSEISPYGSESPPMFVIVADNGDLGELMNHPTSYIKYFERLDPGQTQFNLDLSQTDLKPGDDIILLTLWDKNYKGGFPDPDPGDMIGFYINTEKLSAAFTAQNGFNPGINIQVNRQIYDFKASVKGEVSESDEGDLTLIAYTGDITSSDFSTLDFNEIIGYHKTEKISGHQNYTLPIMPYGHDIPVENVFIFGLLDVNRNGTIDEGDKIGYYSNRENGLPSPVTITGDMANIDIDFHMTVPAPSGYNVSLSGTLDLPTEYYQNPSETFIIVAKNDNMDAILNDPSSAILYFERLERGQTEFNVDLSGTDIAPGDELLIIGLWDRNFSVGFPDPDAGDVIGFYMDKENYTVSYIVPEADALAHIKIEADIDVNREVFDFDAKIRGTVQGDETGEVILIAYSGALDSSDFSTLDFNSIIGFNRLEKNASTTPYELSILPYGQDIPIETLYIYALLDKNSNGLIDNGDQIGYYSTDETGLPTPIRIPESAREIILTDIHLNFFTTVPKPGNVKMSLNGSFSLPPGVLNSPETPVFIIISEDGNPDYLLNSPATAIKYFQKISQGNFFNIDLSGTDLKPENKIMIICLWDGNYNGGFPYPDRGDKIGFYMDTKTLSAGYTLKKGANTGIHIDINRSVYDYEANVSGLVRGDDTGELTIIVYTGTFESMDVTQLDFKKILGFTQFTKDSYLMNYEVPVLPYGENLPIRNAFIFALLDKNRNGVTDAGDKIGYYSHFAGGLPSGIDIYGNTPNIHIDFAMDVPVPSGYHIVLNGTLSLPHAYYESDSPAFVIVAKSVDIEKLLADPVSYIKYFKKLPPRGSGFTIDLSGTDLKPGEDVMVIGVWDKNFTGGFPNPDKGDYIGFYINTESFGTTYTLKDGSNSGFNIPVNREVFNFEASVSGTVHGPSTGDLTLVAYSGEIESSDLTELNLDDISGYKKMFKDPHAINYKLDILPYGRNIPIYNTFIFALLDTDRNGHIGEGDKIGYYSANENSFPTDIVINEGETTGLDIHFHMSVPKPSGFNMVLNGTLDMPDTYHASSPPVFIIVAETDDIDELIDNPTTAIKYFKKLPSGATEFRIDLLNTDLVPGDDVYLFALWDKNYTSGFPNPDTGDIIGFYMDAEKLSAEYPLTDGDNSGINITVNREIFDFKASIEGTITAPAPGDLIILAYAGEINTNNFLDVDTDSIIGYKKTYKDTGANTIPYELQILPYGKDLPINDVYVIAILDINQNGQFDTGDKIGYYSDSFFHTPEGILIPDDGNNPTIVEDIDIEVNRIKYNYDTTVTFKIDPDTGLVYPKQDAPLLAIVIHEDGLSPVNPTVIDTNYVMGMAHFTFKNDPAYDYHFRLLDVIYENLSYDEKVNVYIYVFLDNDDDGEISFGDSLAFYWEDLCIGIPNFQVCSMIPKVFELNRDSENIILNANDEPGNPFGVKFMNLSLDLGWKGTPTAPAVPNGGMFNVSMNQASLDTLSQLYPSDRHQVLMEMLKKIEYETLYRLFIKFMTTIDKEKVIQGVTHIINSINCYYLEELLWEIEEILSKIDINTIFNDVFDVLTQSGMQPFSTSTLETPEYDYLHQIAGDLLDSSDMNSIIDSFDPTDRMEIGNDHPSNEPANPVEDTVDKARPNEPETANDEPTTESSFNSHIANENFPEE